MHDASGDGVSLVVPQGDGLTILEVDQQLSVED
jgi:hypothetical protein